jgi:hypothetical protein
MISPLILCKSSHNRRCLTDVLWVRINPRDLTLTRGIDEDVNICFLFIVPFPQTERTQIM